MPVWRSANVGLDYGTTRRQAVHSEKQRGSAAACIQRVVHCRQNLIDSKRPVLVRVTRQAGGDIGIPKPNVHHREDFVHGDVAVTV